MDFAALGIRIDSSQTKQAFSDLERLADAGGDAEKAILGVGNAGKKAAVGLSETGKAAKESARSIDDYVKKLELTAKTNGMSAREAKLYEMALQGASKAQLQAADSAIRLNEGYEKGVEIGRKVRTGLIATAAAAVALGGASVVAFNKITESIAKYQELSEKTGESASNIASLQTASDLSGVSLDTVAAASIRLTTALSKTDDESKLVAKGIKALGLNFDEFKKQSPAQQLDSVAKAMAGFQDGSEKSAAAVAIFGKAGAELIPFLNDLADGGERNLRLTDQQIKAADDHAKAQARLKSEITQLAQSIVAQSLPAVTDLVGAFKDAIAEATGLGGAATSLKNNNSIQTFAEDGARFLATLADYAVKVGEAFNALGKTIGGVGAIQFALVKGEFKEALNIGKELVGDSKTFFSAPSLSEALEKRIADRRRNDAQRSVEERGFNPLAKINATALNTDRTPKGRKDNSAAQEAKAQLAFDLDDIRKAQDALANTINNGDKLLEARRAANLVTEAEYWKQKRAFLVQNDADQAAALDKEIARLQQEKLSGKDKIDNDRKILDAQAKLAKVRENATANLQVLSIKETDALDKIRIKFEEARVAAQTYVDTISKQNDREIAGLGKGAQAREIDARRSQRDDQFQGRREQLESQRRANQITSEEFEKFLAIESDAHGRALAADEKYWKQKLEKQKDWATGASEALQNYIDEVDNAAKRTEKLITDGLGGLTDSITDAILGDGNQSFAELGKSIAKQIVRGFVEQEITKPIAEFLQSSLKDSDSIVSKIFGGVAGGTGSGLIGSLLGVSGAGGAAGGAGAAASATAASSAQATLATTATSAAAAISVLASAASAAAASMGGSSLSSALGASNLIGSSGGDALGSLIGLMGWSDGGFTGPGGKYQPAGIVHAGEGVLNQQEVRAIGGEQGFNFLRRLIKRGYADGGFVGSVMGGNLMGGGDTTNSTNLEVHNHFAAGTSSETIDQAAGKFYRALQKSQRNK
ncbi:hypothetical protein J7E49_06880 [Variovorax paradoxus]|nr:hypothetical protein [Variovorax paradoxus]